MCESVYMHTTKLYMYRLSDNFKSFFDFISTHTVYKLPNLNRTFVLVYTFTIQSFISYRQSMGPSHVWECVHTTKLHMYRLSDNFKSFFSSHFHTHCLQAIKPKQDLCFSVHIHNPEFHKLSTKYGPFTCVRVCTCIQPNFTCIS